MELEAALGALRRLVRDAVVEEARLGDLLGRPLLQLLLELLAPNRPDVRLKHVSAASSFATHAGQSIDRTCTSRVDE